MASNISGVAPFNIWFIFYIPEKEVKEAGRRRVGRTRRFRCCEFMKPIFMATSPLAEKSTSAPIRVGLCHRLFRPIKATNVLGAGQTLVGHGAR